MNKKGRKRLEKNNHALIAAMRPARIKAEVLVDIALAMENGDLRDVRRELLNSAFSVGASIEEIGKATIEGIRRGASKEAI